MNEQPKFPEPELARVADGSLAPEREAELRRRIAADPELSAALAEQEHAVALLRAADVPAPAALRGAVARQLRDAQRPRRWRPRLRLALPSAATVAVAAALAVVLLGGGTATGPTLRQTVHLTLAAAVYPAPSERGGSAPTLDITAAGIPFPYWQRTVGWRALGARVDHVAGRTVVTVFYGGRAGRRVGYAIVGGEPIAVGAGRVVMRGAVRYRLLRDGATELVTWLRAGHTCVIAGRGVGAGTLLALATANVAA